MNIRIPTFVAALIIQGLVPAQASTKSAARVTAAKGPVRLTLKLHSTKVKAGKSIWYKLELKNIGDKPLRVTDRVFRDPWAIHENCRTQRRLYIEVQGPGGAMNWVRPGGEMETWDYFPKRGENVKLTPEEVSEIKSIQNNDKLTARQKTFAMDDINDRHHSRKQWEEISDPAKQLWLSPGQSTATLAWAYRERNPDQFTDHSKEEAQIGDFTQLWSYALRKPGTYRIRAVYDHAMPEGFTKRHPEYKRQPPLGAVKIRTPFIEFKVLK